MNKICNFLKTTAFVSILCAGSCASVANADVTVPNVFTNGLVCLQSLNVIL